MWPMGLLFIKLEQELKLMVSSRFGFVFYGFWGFFFVFVFVFFLFSSRSLSIRCNVLPTVYYNEYCEICLKHLSDNNNNNRSTIELCLI